MDKHTPVPAAREIMQSYIMESGRPSTGQQWEFVDVQSQKHTSTRQLIRAHVARRSNPKNVRRGINPRYTTSSSDKFRPFFTGKFSAATGLSHQRVDHPRSNHMSQSRVSRCGPVSILGAGRVDPFRTFPSVNNSPELHKCFDYFNTTYLPELHPIDEGGTLNPVSKAWIPEMIASPLYFHAVILSASTTLDVLQESSTYRLLRLYHEGELIKELRKALEDPYKRKNPHDEIIMAVNALAVEAGTVMPPTTDSPFNTPLTNFSWINLRGRVIYDDRHSKILYDLIMMRGGLRKLRLPHMATTISSAAVGGSTTALKSSPFPYIPAYGKPWKRNWTPDTNPTFPNGRGNYLRRLVLFGFSQNVLDLSHDLCDQTERIHKYCANMAVMSKYDIMEYKDMRHDIQHRLISLPDLKDEPLYESYRQSLWIYSFAVTYGAPFRIDIRRKLVLRLASALKRAKHDPRWKLIPEALLWMHFFGGITATGQPERVWFVNQISTLLDILKLKQWAEVKAVLNSFLWLGLACDSGGRILYNEASSSL